MSLCRDCTPKVAARADAAGDMMNADRTVLTDEMGARVAPLCPGQVTDPGVSGGSGVGPQRIFVNVLSMRDPVIWICRWHDQARASMGLRGPKGGLMRKVVALTDAVGHRIRCGVLPGQTHDLKAVSEILDDLTCETLIGDKACDADGLLETLAECGARAVIPPQSNRSPPRDFDRDATQDALTTSGPHGPTDDDVPRPTSRPTTIARLSPAPPDSPNETDQESIVVQTQPYGNHSPSRYKPLTHSKKLYNHHDQQCCSDEFQHREQDISLIDHRQNFQKGI